MYRSRPATDHERSGPPGPSGENPVISPPPASCGTRRRRWRIGVVPALLALLTTAGVIEGCSSAASPGPAGSTTPHSPSAAASGPAGAGVFTSQHYSYTEALPPGWTAGQATQRWDGTGAPGFEDSDVDLFTGPRGIAAWGFAEPSRASPAGYARATARAAAAAHPCPAVPPTNQAIRIGGAPARLLGMHCPPQGGVLVLMAVTTHHKTALVFAFQDPSGAASAERADRAAFREFLAGIRFQR